MSGSEFVWGEPLVGGIAPPISRSEAMFTPTGAIWDYVFVTKPRSDSDVYPDKGGD